MKTILSLLLVFVVSASFSQENRYTIYQANISEWDDLQEDFNTVYSKESNMTLIIEDWVVSVNDLANSRYILNNYYLEENSSEAIIVTYTAIDEQRKSCNVIFFFDRKSNVKAISFVYSEYMYTYLYY